MPDDNSTTPTMEMVHIHINNLIKLNLCVLDPKPME